MRMRAIVVAGLASAALAAGGCGGESAPPPAPGSPERPLEARRTPPGAASAAPATPGYNALVKEQSRRPRSRFTPCNLVTERQAQAIVGAAMRDPVEAAQGPTCIYRSRDGRSFVTLAVQALRFDAIRPRLRLRRRVAVAGRTAYCGTYGQPMLYLPLRRGRVPSVAAQCPTPRRFAARAVRQL
jgi:hypothetical protein